MAFNGIFLCRSSHHQISMNECFAKHDSDPSFKEEAVPTE